MFVLKLSSIQTIIWSFHTKTVVKIWHLSSRFEFDPLCDEQVLADKFINDVRTIQEFTLIYDLDAFESLMHLLAIKAYTSRAYVLLI